MHVRHVIVGSLLVVGILTGCESIQPVSSVGSATSEAVRAGSASVSTPSPTPAPVGRIGTTVAIPGGSYTDLTPQQLSSLLAKKSFSLVNVHIPYEGELAGTDAFIPFTEITRRLDKLPADKNAPLVLYCRSGRMSTEASQALVRLGYTNVMNLAGGMNAWQATGYRLLRKR